MKKPHEEAWFVEYGSVMVKDDSPDGAFLMSYGGNVNRGARCTLAAAAPDMARALLEAERFMVLLLNGDPAWQKVDREALRADMFNALLKAGVL